MAIRSKNRVSVNFSMSGMTDIVFLLLIFFMLTSTLIAPNALKLLFPQRGQTVVTKAEIPVVELSASGQIFLNGRRIELANLDGLLSAKLDGQADPAVTIIADRDASVKKSVEIMNVAAKRNYKVILKEKGN